MHTLHTTPAFVINSYQRGESDRVFRMYTRDLGLVYAHARGVREMRNRNRYALATGTCADVTLVRGKEAWRITSVRSGALVPTSPREVRSRIRKILSLLTGLTARDDPDHGLFALVQGAERAFTEQAHHRDAIEMLTVLRLLHAMGYIDAGSLDPTVAPLVKTSSLHPDMFKTVEEARLHIVERIHGVLHSAST